MVVNGYNIFGNSIQTIQFLHYISQAYFNLSVVCSFFCERKIVNCKTKLVLFSATDIMLWDCIQLLHYLQISQQKEIACQQAIYGSLRLGVDYGVEFIEI